MTHKMTFAADYLDFDPDEAQAELESAQPSPVDLAIEYFDIDGWDKYQAWLELGDDILNMAVDDGHPSAKYAKILKDANYKPEEAE